MSAIRPFRNLSQLLDVSITGMAARDGFMWDSGAGAWVNRPIESADISDATPFNTPDTVVLRGSTGEVEVGPLRADGYGATPALQVFDSSGNVLLYTDPTTNAIQGNPGLLQPWTFEQPSAGTSISLGGGAGNDPNINITPGTLGKVKLNKAVRFLNSVWQEDSNGHGRFYFVDGGYSIYKSPAGGSSLCHSFRNADDTTIVEINADGSAAFDGTLGAPTINATTTLRGPYKGSSASTATLGDGYNGGMDFTFVNSGILRFTEANVAGTNDVFHQFYPPSNAGYGIVEAWTAAGLILGTGNNSNPVIFKVNRTEVARLNATELLLGNGVDLVGDGYYNIKGNSSGGGRIDLRADQVLVFGTLAPQSDMYMGNQGTPNSYIFGWTGQLTGNYRSIYSKYVGGLASTSGDLVFLAQWFDGSWDHEMGRWNDHGTLTLTQGLKVDPGDGGYGVQFGSNAYNRILESDGLEIGAASHHRFINGASTEVMRVNSTSLLIGQTSDDAYAAKLQVGGRIHADSIGLGGSVGATGLGSVAYVVPLYDKADSLLGYVPIYSGYSA